MSAVPVTDLTSAERRAAEATTTAAAEGVAALVAAVVDHLRESAGDCPIYCVGLVATEALDGLTEMTTRQLLLVAVSQIARDAVAAEETP